jgi:hypothetical protein
VGTYIVYTTRRQLIRYDSEAPTVILDNVDVRVLESDRARKFWVLLANGTLYYSSLATPISSNFPPTADMMMVDTTPFIPSGRSIVSITGSTNYVAFLLDNGTVAACFGHFADFGDKNTDGSCALQLLPAGEVVERVIPGGGHFLMRSSTGRDFFSGTNSLGEHGNGQTTFANFQYYVNPVVTEFNTTARGGLTGRTVDDYFLMPYGSYAVSTVAVTSDVGPIGFTATEVLFALTNIPDDATSFTAEAVIEGAAPVSCTNTFTISDPSRTGTFACTLPEGALESSFLSKSSAAETATLFLRIHVFKNDLILERSAWAQVATVFTYATLDSCNDSTDCGHANTAGTVLQLKGRGFGSDPAALYAYINGTSVACRGMSIVNNTFTCALDSAPAEGLLSIGVFLYSRPSQGQLSRYSYKVRYVFPGTLFANAFCRTPLT